MHYWGSESVLMAASFDGNVRLYDDGDASEEGIKKHTMDRHRDAVTCLDFKNEEQLCASCGDDGVIYVFNYSTHRQEGCLKLDPSDKEPEAIKVCKFLAGTDILVSADLDGYMHFWCVTAWPHPKKNVHLCSRQDPSPSEFQEIIKDDKKGKASGRDPDEDSEEGAKPAHFPIRAMDFDPETKMLYTGDEMGYMNKWDLTGLIEKCE